MIDYFSFTSKIHNNASLITDLGLYGIDQWQTTKGNYGYLHCSFFGGMRLYFGKEDESVYFSMSGQGCRSFETYSTLSWHELFFKLIDDEEHYNITRIDVACDEKENILDINKIHNYTERKQIAMRFQWYLCNKGSEGISVVLGSPQSNIRIRIYDKNAERGFTEGHWIRCELQLRDELALAMVKKLLHFDTGRCFTGVLNNYIRYIKNDDNEKWRCSTTNWWQKFINTAEKIKIYESVGVDYNLHRLEHFLDKQIGNSMYTYWKCCGSDVTKLLDIIKNHEGTLSIQQKNLIQEINDLKEISETL